MTVYLAVAAVAWIVLWPATVHLAQRRLSLGTAAGLAVVLALVWPISAVAAYVLLPRHRTRR